MPSCGAVQVRALFFRGEDLPEAAIDLVARMISLGRAHGAYPITGAVGTAGAAAIEGTLVWEMVRLERPHPATVTIGHPGGSIEVKADFFMNGAEPIYLSATVYRTARRIMDGHVYLPGEAAAPAPDFRVS